MVHFKIFLLRGKTVSFILKERLQSSRHNLSLAVKDIVAIDEQAQYCSTIDILSMVAPQGRTKEQQSSRHSNIKRQSHIRSLVG